MTTLEITKIVSLSIAGTALINTLFYNYLISPRINKGLKKFENFLKKEESLRENKWQTKRNACFKALSIADALLSNYEYPNVNKKDMIPGKTTTEEVRTCFNELVCSCDNNEVIEILKTIINSSVSPDIIVDLRNAVRRELEFGKENFDNDRNLAFVGKIGCDPECK